MLRKKPWNRIDLPVYSISSVDENDNGNMNIITYASQISMKPKQFICGIYRGSQSLKNVERNNVFVLQLLASHQYNLINLLGKKSGSNINKIEKLEKKKLVTNWKDFIVLKECLSVMKMSAEQLIYQSFPQPDHVIFLCTVADYQNLNEGNVLTLNILRDRGLVRM